MSKNSEYIKKQYQEKFEQYGIDPKSLFWRGKGAAHQRFRQMWAEIDFNNMSVLDIGCGFGEMAKFLDKRYQNVRYTGVDIVPEFVNTASELFPHHKFYNLDYFEHPLDGKFDVVLASGTLNSNFGSDQENMEFRKKAIKVMFEHAEKVMVFNMLGSHPQPENDPESNVWYADSLEIIDCCFSLTRRILLRHQYHPTDFTVFLYPIKK